MVISSILQNVFVQVLLGIISIPIIYCIFLIAKIFIRYNLKIRYYTKRMRCLPSMTFFRILETEGLETLQTQLYNNGNVEDLVCAGSFFNGEPIIMVNNPEDIKRVLDDEKFPKLPDSYEPFEAMVGKGLITSKGALWKRQRRLLTPIFHFHKLKMVAPVMEENIHNAIAKLREKNGEKVDPVILFCDLALRVIVESAFGGASAVGNLSPELMGPIWRSLAKESAAYFFTAVLFGNITPKLPLPWVISFMNKIKGARKMVQDSINKKRAYLQSHSEDEEISELQDRSDLVLEMLKVRDEDGKPIPDDLIIDEAMTFLLAGHETTSNTLAWVCYFLTRYPEVLRNLQAEVDSVLSDDSDVFSLISKLPYCRAVLNETLRLRPVAPFLDRYVPQDCVMSNGVVLPKGTYIEVGIIAAHLNPKNFEDPLAFKPERFLNENLNGRHAYSFVPFSAGNRNCIGQKFAMQEAVSVLALFVKNFDIIGDVNERVYYSLQAVATPLGLKCSFVPRN